jgi:hypothetical protein
MVGIVNMVAGNQPRIHDLTLSGSNSTSTATTITIPAAAAAGDIAILFDRATNSGLGAPNAVTPSGWTELNTTSVSTSGGSLRSSIAYKALVAGDPGTTVTGMNRLGAGGITKLMTTFRPIYRSSVLRYAPVAFNFGSINNGQSVPSQTIDKTTIFNNNPGIVVAQYTSYNTSLAGAGVVRGFTTTLPTPTELNNGIVHYIKYTTALLGSNPASNTTVSLSGAPFGSRLILQSGILTIN